MTKGMYDDDWEEEDPVIAPPELTVYPTDAAAPADAPPSKR